jgi:alpha-tubulin suppressor-like RCC1 family protein
MKNHIIINAAVFLFLPFVLLRPLVVIGSPFGATVEWGLNTSVSDNFAQLSDSGISVGLVRTAGLVMTNAVSVAAGDKYALALRSDGTVVGWGLNSSAQATGSKSTIPDGTNGFVTIDGQVVSNVVEIAASWSQSCARKNDGTVAAWGTGPDGNILRSATGLSNVISISAWRSLAVKNDGTIVSISDGKDHYGLSNIVAVAVQKQDHGNLVALKNDGTVVESTSWNWASFVPVAGLSNVVAIAAGQARNVALRKDGTVVGWGYANDVPAGISNVIAISIGYHNSLALKRDGTVIAWGRFGFQPATVPEGLSNVVSIAAGDDFCLAITTNAAVADKFRQK